MNISKLARVDINLLVALQVLLEEKQVARAAQRLYITQSAMSKTLGRLRELFDDELLTRSGRSMIPTPKALELNADLEPILLSIDDLVSKKELTPQEFSSRMVISSLDFFSLPLLPSLISILSKEAPKMRIKVTNNIDNHIDDLTEGKVDVVIHGYVKHYDNEDLYVEELLLTKFIVLFGVGHPLKILDNPTVEDVFQYPEVALKVPETQNIPNSWLRSKLMRYIGLEQIVLETPDYLTAIQTLAVTNSIMVTPRLSLSLIKRTNAITSIPFPKLKDDNMEFRVVMVSHKRTFNSPEHIWLREKIKSIYASQNAIIANRKD